MFCEIILAVGLGLGCTEPPPPPARDQAAEILIEQEARQQAEFEEAIARRNKFYGRSGKCSDCGVMNTDPFPQPKE
jgi:hypothetical protein